MNRQTVVCFFFTIKRHRNAEPGYGDMTGERYRAPEGHEQLVRALATKVARYESHGTKRGIEALEGRMRLGDLADLRAQGVAIQNRTEIDRVSEMTPGHWSDNLDVFVYLRWLDERKATIRRLFADAEVRP